MPPTSPKLIDTTAPSIRFMLLMLIVASALPGLLGAPFLFQFVYQHERNQLEQSLVQTARALSQAVDREVSISMAAGEILATSPSFTSGDLPAMYLRATRVAELGRTGNLVLTDETGQQIFNTLKPLGAPWPRHGDPEAIKTVFKTGRPVISHLFIGGVRKRPALSIDIPVRQHGAIKYALSVAIWPDRLTEILRQQHLPPTQMAAIFDGKGIIVARTHQPERFVGKKGTPVLLERLQEVDEGMVEAVTVEGQSAFVAFSRSRFSGWTVGMSASRNSLMREMWNFLTVLFLGMLALLGTGVGLAWGMGGRIAHSMQALSSFAVELGTGQRIMPPRFGIKEADDVAQSLGAAASLLAQRSSQLEVAHRELEEFSYAISHDLRAPLRAINGFSGILLEEHAASLDTEAKRLLKETGTNAHWMGRLIDDLLEFVRLGRCQMTYGPLRIDHMVQDAFEKLKIANPEHAVQLELPELPKGYGDTALMRIVIVHLLSNAYRMTRSRTDALIEVGGTVEDGECHYYVRDNGEGFDMAYVDKLFKVFERVHARSENEGTGTGLAMVKRIIGRHGGRVWAEGNAGKGATIHFTLPKGPTAP